MHEFRRHDDIRIPLDEGTVAATRYEPRGATDPPALLMYYPYRKDDYLTFGAYHSLFRYLAAHGYEVLTADVLGTGASSGTRQTFAESSQEGAEAAAIVEWLADRGWTNGRIGMFGKSYAGRTCLAAAAQQPESLEAIVPIVAPSGGYRDRNGGVLHPYNDGGRSPIMQALQTLPPSYRDDDGRWLSVWKDRLDAMEDVLPWSLQLVGHERNDEFWAGRKVDIDAIRTPTLAATGWRDMFVADAIEYMDRIDAPTRLVLGPWRHTMPHRGREVAIDFRKQMVAWFDEFLRDASDGLLSGPDVVFWTEQSQAPSDGCWRSTDNWPTLEQSVDDRTKSERATGKIQPWDSSDDDTTATAASVRGTAESESLVYALCPDGLAEPGEFRSGTVAADYEHDHTVGMDSVQGIGPPADTNADDVRSLCFETASLDNPVEFTGSGGVSLRVRSTIPDPLLVARVVDVSPSGSARLVTHGRIRASHRNGHTDPETLVPERDYRIEIPLRPISRVFDAGHRVRLAISAAHFPAALPGRKQGSFTILSAPNSPSTLQCPGERHDGTVNFDRIEMGDPDADRIPVESEYVTQMPGSWETTRDHRAGTATVRTTDGKHIDLPHGGRMTLESDVVVEVESEDPGTLVVTSNITLELTFPTERTEVRVRCRLARDEIHLRTTVNRDGHEIFEESWRR